MLTRLLVQNYALFQELEVEFPAGLTVLTGETGAGKSLLVGAIGLILGKRADTSVLNSPDRKCIVEAEFQLPQDPQYTQQLEALLAVEGIEPEPGGLLLRREISASGRSRAFVNDSPVNLNALREVAAMLVDLHGQQDSRLLTDPHYPLQVLDAFGRHDHLLDQWRRELRQWRELQQELTQLQQRLETARQEAEYRNYRLQELTAAELQPGELASLEQELKRLDQAETFGQTLAESLEHLENGEVNARILLVQALGGLQKFAELDNRLPLALEHLQQALAQLDEAEPLLRQTCEDLSPDPDRLQQVNERLGLYQDLLRKHQAANEAELIALRDRLAHESLELEESDVRLRELHKQLDVQADQLGRTGLALEQARRESAHILELEVLALLKAVGLENTRFEIAVERTETSELGIPAPPETPEAGEQRYQPAPDGFNQVRFMLQANPGMPLLPLSQVASGGEQSRVMLALKTALAGRMALPTLIFDEIDTGVSGSVALKVGRVMEQLAQRHQVLTITHLPQIAGRGQSHWFIRKQVEANTTTSTLVRLEGERRVQAIAEMIAGTNPSDSARQSAAELLQDAPTS